MKLYHSVLFVLALTTGCATGNVDSPPEQPSTPTATVVRPTDTVRQAKPVETWECRQGGHDILVVATVDDGRRTGTIAAAGVTHEAQFTVAGFNRRWDFPKEDPRYSFLVEPGGQATYFEETRRSSFMSCRQRGSAQE